MRISDAIIYALVLLASSFMVFFYYQATGLSGSLLFYACLLGITFLALGQRIVCQNTLSLSIEAMKKNLLGDYATLEHGVKVVDELQASIKALQTRKEVHQALSRQLGRNPSFLGVWAAYEPNVFDGKDSTLGRMSSYYYRKKGQISHMPLEGVEKEEFYRKPMASGKLEILEPFHFEIEGQDVLMTTVAFPLRRGPGFIGVVGVDILLTETKTIYRDLVFFQNRFHAESKEALVAHLVRRRGMAKLLGYAIEAGQKNQREMATVLSVAAKSLTTSSHSITGRNHDLSQRVVQQASSLEEIGAITEEFAHTLSQNVKAAEVAADLSQDAENKAGDGVEIVQNAISAINEISLSSKRIDEIRAVIDDIAFRTNLLALNAAVEAARVGAEGKGFAVVAAEVRNLAQHSANAAKEIGDLVWNTLEKVDRGATLAHDSGESLKTILQSNHEVARCIREIAEATDEQREGAKQIQIAIKELDQMTQQNAALVQETAAASDDMEKEAQDLQDVMARFKVLP